MMNGQNNSAAPDWMLQVSKTDWAAENPFQGGVGGVDPMLQNTYNPNSMTGFGPTNTGQAFMQFSQQFVQSGGLQINQQMQVRQQMITTVVSNTSSTPACATPALQTQQ